MYCVPIVMEDQDCINDSNFEKKGRILISIEWSSLYLEDEWLKK